MFTILELAINCDYDTLEAQGFYGTDASLEERLELINRQNALM
jgi:hypothetical protein